MMINQNSQAKIGVLGAGLMGCCLALELAQRGCSVTLIDAAETCMAGASLHNEGKLHLGFVYAKDPSRLTHGLMLRGSLSFARIIEKLTGCCAEELSTSKPFHYFVPISSQLTLNQIEEHFVSVEQNFLALSRETGDCYLGQSFEGVFERNSDDCHVELFSPELTLGSFRTEERSISTTALAGIIRQAVARQPLINFIGNTEVIAACRLSSGEVEVEVLSNGSPVCYRYPCVANCLWDDRLRVDSTAGINDFGPWMLRYKATVTVQAPGARAKRIPSATGVLGLYGDVVNHCDNSYYISWYPNSMIASTREIYGRKLHDMVHKCPISKCVRMVAGMSPRIAEVIKPIVHRRFVKKNIEEMAAYVPSMRDLLQNIKTTEVGGGVIMARGETDINDPSSVLHQRSAIGPKAYGSYFTIDTGKYCMAPLFALETADMIQEVIGSVASK